MPELCSTHGPHQSLPSHETTKHPDCRDVYTFQCQNEHIFLLMFETQPSTELISNNAGLRPTLCSVSHDRNVRVAQTFVVVVSRDSHPFPKRCFIDFLSNQSLIPSDKL